MSLDGWTVGSSALDVARGLVASYHYARGTSNTATYCHGLFDPLGVQAGATIWLPPTRTAAESVADDDWRGVLMLSRLVVAPDAPKNAASFLLGRSMKLVDRGRWPVLLTYASARVGHSGAIYRATNWTALGEQPYRMGDWVDPSTGRIAGRKRGSRTLSVGDMRAAGYAETAGAPKLKFVHDARRRR